MLSIKKSILVSDNIMREYVKFVIYQIKGCNNFTYLTVNLDKTIIVF